MMHLLFCGLFYGFASVLLWLSPAVGEERSQPSEAPHIDTDVVVDALTDAKRFFELLVDRYRNLTSYRDVSRIVQIIQHDSDGQSERVETEMSSEVAGESLRTETAFSQIRRSFGLSLPLQVPEQLAQAELKYQLWMLPHLTLMFSEEPLRDFRDGVQGGFTATELTPVTVDDRPLVHLQLRSGEGDNEPSSAEFDIYVDPNSMLIERIRGRQRLPDGRDYHTTVDITPQQHESEVDVCWSGYRHSYPQHPMRETDHPETSRLAAPDDSDIDDEVTDPVPCRPQSDLRNEQANPEAESDSAQECSLDSSPASAPETSGVQRDGTESPARGS